MMVSAQLHSYGSSSYSFQSIVDSIVRASWIFFEAIAVICFVLAGILFLTAQGQPEKLQTARAAFVWGVVGVIVGIIAYGIITLVSDLLQNKF